MTVRDARADDAPAIVSILDREIREGVAHFGDTAPTASTEPRSTSLGRPAEVRTALTGTRAEC